ncbi:MAG: hypothetical protein ACRD43_03840 [Pyrinomonadaceae bacterium]
MVNRSELKVAGEIDKLNDVDRAAVLSYVSEALSSQKNQNKENPNDELIGSLANAHENRRAQQVTEWEQIGLMTMQRAA